MSEMDNKQSEENTSKEPPTQEQIDSSIRYFAEFIVDCFLEQFKKEHPEAGDNIYYTDDEKPSRIKKQDKK